jgi:putative ABC transport system permease protein
MERLIQDLRFALRRLRKSPGFTLIALLSLALGIGANTAIFSLVDAVLLRDPAVREPGRVLEIYGKSPEFSYMPMSMPDFREFKRATSHIFSSSYGSAITFVPRDRGDRVESLLAEMVTGDYFTTLGLAPAAGRLFTKDDDVAAGAHAVVVLSWDYWAREYGQSRAVIGQQLRIIGRSYTIVGVAPREHEGNLRGLAPALYVPMMMINQMQPSQDDQLAARGNHSTFVRARLRPGVTLAQAEAVLLRFANDQRASQPNDWPANMRLQTVSLSDLVVNPMLDSFIVLAAGLLSVVVGLVLLIACANLASFLLAQARDRQREIAIRLAIGAGRTGLVRQLLTESVALALIGGVFALGLAKLLLSVLLRADLPLPMPITLDASLHPVVLLFALGVSVLAGILFGLAPALQATRTDVITTVKNENTGGGPARHLTLRNTLVVGQVAVSLVLLVTAGLFLRSLSARQFVDPGFGSAPTALLQFSVSAERYPKDALRLFVQRLEDDVMKIPGVQAAGITGNIHLNTLSISNLNVNVDGFQPPQGQPGFVIDNTQVDPGFFRAAGIPIVSGRNFDDLIDGEGAPRVAIINQVMAARFWPDQNPLGRTFRSDTTTYRVIGVTRSTKVRTLGEEPRSFVYTAFSQDHRYFVTLLASTSGDAEQLLPQVLRTARSIEPDIILVEAKTMARHLAIMLLPARLAAVVFGAFAMLALTLALIGVYGVVSYAVSRRAREVGIRMSLGAKPLEVVRLLMRDGFVLVAVGGTIGLGIALLTARVLRSVLFGIQPIDPITFTVGPLLLLAIGALAAWVPAQRASRVDPARVLKGD